MTLLQSIAAILPSIEVNQPFYRKICQGFTHYLVGKTGSALLHGYNVHPADPWKNFTEEEFQAMVGINGVIELQQEPMQLHSRQEKWFQPKL
jgi:hypothetical protein